MRIPVGAVLVIVATLLVGCSAPEPEPNAQSSEVAEPLDVTDETDVATSERELPDASAEPDGQPPSNMGNWNVEERTDPITDVVNVFSSLPSESGDQVLVVRCMANVTGVMFLWGDYLGSDDATNVTHRFDDHDPETTLWPMTTSSNAHLRTSGRAIRFARQLLDAERLAARTTPFRESPVTAIFSLAGTRDALAPVRTACGW